MPDRVDIQVIIGASSQDYPSWVRTQQAELVLTRRTTWEAMFRPKSISRLLAEHVWEHLDPDEAAVAAGICFSFFRLERVIRCDVPDGLFPDRTYHQLVQVGGCGPPDHPAANHKVLYDYRTLC